MVWLMLAAPVAAEGPASVALQALFREKAIFLIDGSRRVLKVGDTSPEGVKLVATDTREETATVEVNGKQDTVRLGVVLAGFTAAGKGSATLYAERGHFFADVMINGVTVRSMVDTGASMIAMNGATARRLGLDYQRSGRPGMANTASGVVRTYNVKLDSVQLGDIVQHNVDAAVIEGSHPTDILLGMSFLGRLDMKRDGEKMELTQRY
jgi:aspartyl protease family protein